MSDTSILLCPLCRRTAERNTQGQLVFFECVRCGQFRITKSLEKVFQSKQPTNWHLISGACREETELNPDSYVYIRNSDDLDSLCETAPTRIPEKAFKLLRFFGRNSQYLGNLVSFNHDEHLSVGYAVNGAESTSLLNYLEEQRHIRDVKHEQKPGALVSTLRLTAGGFEAIENRSHLSPLIVFISSTCYDLSDIRAELATFLESNGCIVRVSDDYERSNVNPTTDSINTCLENLRGSEILLGILDRRYGPPLPPPWENLSATHVEIREARRLEMPCQFFIRDATELELRVLKHDASAKTPWIVDQHDKVGLARLREEIISLRSASNKHSNWYDQFRTIVDLKRIVLKRLVDYHTSPERRRRAAK